MLTTVGEGSVDVISILLQGKEIWNDWRKKNPKVVIKLRRVDLSGIDLSGIELSGADLSGADLSGADLSGAYLHRANLSDANLTEVDLSGAILTNADLGRAILTEADLSGAILTNADLGRAILTEADLSGAMLNDADLGGAMLNDANLRGAILTEAGLRYAILRDADLGGAILNDANLRGAILTNAGLRYATLRDANLTDADLGGAILNDANLRGAILTNADLRSAILRDADLRDAILTDTDLRSAIFRDGETISETFESFGIIHFRITEEPLTGINFTTFISSITELHTKCWLIQNNRLADLITYTQTHDPQYAREANLVITYLSKNSPADIKVDLGAAELVTALNEVWKDRSPEKKRELELKNEELCSQIKIAEQKAQDEHHKNVQELDFAEQHAALEAEKHRIELQREYVALQKEQLELEKQEFALAKEKAEYIVNLIHPGLDDASRAMAAAAIVSNIFQLEQAKGLDIIMSTLPTTPNPTK